MVNKDLLKEIKFIVVRAFFLDIVLVAAASLFVSFVQALTGAVLGTILLAADMFLLSLSLRIRACSLPPPPTINIFIIKSPQKLLKRTTEIIFFCCPQIKRLMME